jgi:carboxypeptidase Taq
MGEALAALRDRMATIADLTNVEQLLSWDQLVMMPERAAPERSQQLRTIETLAHAMLIDPETRRLLDDAERELGAGNATEVDAALIRVTRYDFDRASRVPSELIGEIAQAASDGYQIWTKARKTDDFARFLPALERNVALRFRYIECFEPAASPYDVLLEDFEPGLTSAEITPIFDRLKVELRPLVDRVVAAADRVQDGVFRQHFPVDRQQEAGLLILERLGFDPASWRLDPTVHPFASSVGIQDIRLTTRYIEDHLSDTLLSSIHEFGHGLYEAQIDPMLRRTPMAGGCSMTLHESQSRFWENMVGRCREFWTLVHPELAAIFPDQLRDASPDDLYRGVNRMQPSLIRIEADELTYGFHIIVRYELELDLVEGRLQAKDLPEAWNAKMKEYLGVEVPNDREGVLQDVHWSNGAIGYFPTYFLGSILAAQLWDRMAAEMTDPSALMAQGDFAPIREWQREQVHRYGRMYTPRETIERAAGGPLDPGPYVAYMQRKVESLYGPAA